MVHSFAEDKTNQLLIKVLKDMEAYQDNTVLIGGWLPYMYTHFVWKNAGITRIVFTSDIDYAVRENFGFKGVPITDMFLNKKRYVKEKVYKDEDTPFGFIVKDGELKMKIDFISHEYMDPHLIEKVAGKGVEVAPIEHTDILLDTANLMSLSVTIGSETAKVSIPVPAAYLYLKGITCSEREIKRRGYKFKKDLWSIYFVAQHTPEHDRPELYARMRAYKEKDPKLFESFCHNLREYFQSEKARGPKAVEELLHVEGIYSARMAYNAIKTLLDNVID